MNLLPEDILRKRAHTLRLYGLLANWSSVSGEDWLPTVIEYEEQEKSRRSHEYRLKSAKIGAFKDRADFDWKHPKKIDRGHINELFTLDFISEGSNVIFIGPNGVGKTMLARNLAYSSVTRGISTRYISASDLLNELGSLTGSMLINRLKRYTRPNLLVIDELGYLSYDAHLADLLYEVISRRYEARASIVVTTNKPFSQWNQVFEGAACVATLIDRLCHRVELVAIEGGSYRATEALERAKLKRINRQTKKKSNANNKSMGDDPS